MNEPADKVTHKLTRRKNVMSKESVLYGTIGLLAGSLLTVRVATSSANANNNSMMRGMCHGDNHKH